MTPQDIAKPDTEDAHQAAFFAWAAMQSHECAAKGWQDKANALQAMFAIPNGGQRHKAEASKLKTTGTRKGVPDIFLPKGRIYEAGHGRTEIIHGLFIEMKKPGLQNHANGGCSEDQIAMHGVLREAGYHVAVCYSWIEAAEVVVKYLS